MGWRMDKLDIKIVFSDEARFPISGNVNSQNKRYWSVKNYVLLQVHILWVKVDVMHAVNATRVIGQIVSETLLHYDTDLLNLFQLQGI